MSDISAIQGWLGEVQSTMSGLGADMEAAAPTGDFAAVFSTAQSVLDTGPGSPTATTASTASTASTTASTGTSSTSTLLNGAGSASSTTSGATVVSTAEKYLGVPYLWGGTTPSGFDCSGFTQYVYGQLGISLPRTADEQSNAGTPVASVADAEPGDLVFYPGVDGTAASPGHVGIYIGNGEMINAPETGTTVSITAVGDPTAIRRILTSSSSLNANIPGDLATSLDNSAGGAIGETSIGDTSTATSATTLGSTATGSTTTSLGAPSTVDATTGTGTTSGATPAALDVPSQYDALFNAAAAQYGVPANLLASMAQVESNYNPNAVSSAGAEGLMQLMPSVASGLGVNPYDPAQAIDGAAQLMASYLAQYHSTADALAAYNAGPNAVAQYGGIPPYGQTEAYVTNVMQVAGISS